MLTDYRKYRKDLTRLLHLSQKIYYDLDELISKKGVQPENILPGQLFISTYQNWYTEAHAFVGQVFPARLNEFDTLYMGNAKRKAITPETYAIRDWFLNSRISETRISAAKKRQYAVIVFERFCIQSQILESAAEHFKKRLTQVESSLSDPQRRTSDDAAARASLDINRIIVENKDSLFADGDASFWEESWVFGKEINDPENDVTADSLLKGDIQ